MLDLDGIHVSYLCYCRYSVDAFFLNEVLLLKKSNL